MKGTKMDRNGAIIGGIVGFLFGLYLLTQANSLQSWFSNPFGISMFIITLFLLVGFGSVIGALIGRLLSKIMKRKAQ